MRRRELRAKLEAQNKMVKARKVIALAILHLQVHMLNFIKHGRIFIFYFFFLLSPEKLSGTEILIYDLCVLDDKVLKAGCLSKHQLFSFIWTWNL